MIALISIYRAISQYIDYRDRPMCACGCDVSACATGNNRIGSESARCETDRLVTDPGRSCEKSSDSDHWPVNRCISIKQCFVCCWSWLGSGRFSPPQSCSDDRLHWHNAESSGLMSLSQDRPERRPPTTPAASHSLCPPPPHTHTHTHTHQSTHSHGGTCDDHLK